MPLRRCFDYLPPASEEQNVADLPKGVRVRVAFGAKEVVGILVAVVTETDVPVNKLKPALAILERTPLYSEQTLALAQWAADYYQHPVGDALMQALPSRLRKGEPLIDEQVSYWRISRDVSLVSALEKLGQRSPKQRQLLTWLAEKGAVDWAEIKTEGFSKPNLQALLDKGLVEAQDFTDTEDETAPLLAQSVLPLNNEQRIAVSAINQAQGFAPMLLEGVTGSGKTEVYLQAAEACLMQSKQVLVLVPEIGLTPQTLMRFKARFNVPIVALHSNLTERQRQLAWQQAGSAHARIVIGTRSAIFTALPALGLIIVDEEHDSSFKQQEGYRYHARDLALVRGQREQVPVVLGSATPSLETLHNAVSDRFKYLRLTERAGAGEAVNFKTVALRGETLRSGLSDEVEQAIDQTLAQGYQVLVFLNRRGFSPALACNECDWMADCQRCDARMTLHKKPPHLHCHHCDSQTGIPRYCPDCGSPNLTPTGVGTERAEDYLRSRFSHVPIFRVDRDSTSRKDAMEEIMREVNQGEPSILVGTQMLAKGHHFAKVTLVVVLDADAGLFSADFRGMEKTAQLLLQVAGRAGRESAHGQALVQTYYPDHLMLNQLFDHGYGEFARAELRNRKVAGMPPYRYLAMLRVEASTPGRAEAFLQSVRAGFEQQFATSEQLYCVGPVPAPMVKRAGHYRAQLILNGVSRAAIAAGSRALTQTVEAHPQKSRVRWSLDIDPVDTY